MAPPGYEKVDLNSGLDLNNKQVYLAQVPADFDPRKAEFKSETEITCKGTTYFVNSSAALSECDVLAESKDGKLAPSTTKLAGLLALTKKVALPKVDYDAVIQPKPRVPQKENLRMRHFPTGYGPKSFGVDETPVSTRGSSEHKKSKSDEAAGEEKPHKKRKKEKSEDGEKKKKKSHKKSSKTD